MTEWQSDRLTEPQNHRIPEGQGKSSIAPTFSKRGYNDFNSGLQSFNNTVNNVDDKFGETTWSR